MSLNFALLLVVLVFASTHSLIIQTKSNKFFLGKLNIKTLGRVYLSGSEFERNTPSTPLKNDSPNSDDNDAESEESTGRKRGTVSESMKERLRKEMQSQGADPNFSNGPILGNPILLISAFVAFLVIVGGKGYFY